MRNFKTIDQILDAVAAAGSIEDAEQLNEELARGNIPARKLAFLLSSQGLPISETTIKDYRYHNREKVKA